MRYKYSNWDAVVIICAILFVAFSLLVHAKASGGKSLTILVAVILLSIAPGYFVFRASDLLYLKKQPEKYGFMTALGGGTAIILFLMFSLTQARSLPGFSLGEGWITALIGLVFIYAGILLRTRPTGRIPHSFMPATIPDTPEAKRDYVRGQGMAFIVSGLLPIPLALLPLSDAWSHAPAIPLIVGLPVGLVINVARARDRHTR